MPTAIAYIRVSTPDQHLGLDAQRAAITAYASAHGFQIAAWHSEVVSGGAVLERRPVLQAAIADVLATGAAALLVSNRDRLARDPLTALLVERAIGPARVLSSSSANGDEPSERLVRGILDNVAAFERAMISIRTRAALAAKKANGWVPAGGRPKGSVDTKPRKVRSDKGRPRSRAALQNQPGGA
jgi:DNA invertase Pin-like site-specific DNA recombinase